MKFVTSIICAAAMSMVWASTVSAQCGFRYGTPIYTFSNTYQYPVKEVIVKEVITPVTVPVLVPAFQYQYVAPCVAAPAAAAPCAAPAPAAAQPVVQQPQTMAMGSNNDIRALARALLQEMKQASGPVGAEDQGPPPVMDFSEQQSTMPAQPQGNFATVLANRCAGCHTGPSSKGGMQIFSAPGVFNVQVDRQRIVRAIEDGRMPPQAVNDPNYRLTPQELALVKAGM